MQLLIPAAKIVNEDLQAIGKLPAIIYPVNQEIVFDYLLKQYNGVCSSIDVICYENADKVHRRLASYKNPKIHIYDLPELNDLGHTIYYGLKNTNMPVIINFADTIVMDNIFVNNEDCFFYCEDYRSEIWTYFRMHNGKITEIFDKSSVLSSDGNKEKLFVGVFQITDSMEFKKCLEKAFSFTPEGISTFYYALQLYSKSHPMTAIKTDNWFDIGHADKYYNSQLEVKAREYNYISIDKNRGILRKTSDEKDKFIGEIKWYLKLPSDIEYVRPRIFSYSTSYEAPYVSMEYYAYHTIHELFVYGDLSYQQWRDIFKRIRFVYDDFRRYTIKDKNITAALEDMYLTKTLQRLEQMKKSDLFAAFFDNGITINEKKYLPLNDICALLKETIPKMLYDVEEFNIIHGDLCFTNIMVDSNLSFIKIIDPRGKFGSYDIYGDKRYELAKLFHSIDGKYDFIIKDLFELNFNRQTSELVYKIHDRLRGFDLYKLFLDSFSEEINSDLKKIELIESLLFLSMIPLHRESTDHQLVMLGTGLEILNRVIKITL